MVAAAAEQGLSCGWRSRSSGRSGEPGRPEFVPACTGPAYGMTRLVELQRLRRRPAGRARAAGRRGRAAASRVRRRAVRGLGRARSTRWPRPTAACWSGRPSARCRTGTVCGSRSPRRCSPGASATADTCTCRCGATGATCSRGGDRPHGMTADGEAFAAGVLDQLPPLLAIGARRARRATCGWCPRTGPARTPCGGARRGRRRCASSPARRQRDAAANLEVKCVRPGRQPVPGGRLPDRRRAGRPDAAAAAAAGDHRATRPGSTRRRRPSAGSPGCRSAGRGGRRVRRRARCCVPRWATILADAVVAVRRAEDAAVRRAATRTRIAAALRWVY